MDAQQENFPSLLSFKNPKELIVIWSPFEEIAQYFPRDIVGIKVNV